MCPGNVGCLAVPRSLLGIRVAFSGSVVAVVDIAAEVKEEFGKDVHPMTIRRVLHEADYNSCVARRKPLISPINQEKRLEFAKEFQSKPASFWDQVLFTDESKFNIFRSDGRITVWRKPNTALEKKNLAPTVNHGGGGVMVWGCMSAAGVGELVFIEEIINKHIYMDILKENLKKAPIS
ncbi:hypothetical protein ACLKA7_001539 [Drosophila subpalustris]